MQKVVQQGGVAKIIIVKYKDHTNSLSHLLYSKGGWPFFNLPDDMVEGGKQWHQGNPLSDEEVKMMSCESLSIDTEEKLTYSGEKELGLFDKVGDDYFFNPVTTNVLGIYSLETDIGNVIDFKFYNEFDRIYFSTNDINSVPRVGDFILFNKIKDDLYSQNEIDSINDKFDPLKLETHCFLMQAEILDVVILSGTGVDTIYHVTIDKSADFGSLNDTYSLVLLNRDNTSIQKDIFYSTFEAIEVHSEQLLGDPFENLLNINLPEGRVNFLNYKTADALGYINQVRHIIGDDTKPCFIFELGNDIKDRFAPKFNEYGGLNDNIFFEFHLPSIFIKEADGNGDLFSNTLVAKQINEDSYLGVYSELYFKEYDYKRAGYLFNDLRIIVIDEPELATALGYNSNRNFVIPKPLFIPGKGNTSINEGTGIDLIITDASNTSPIVIKTLTNHNLSRGTKVYVTGVLGNTAANGVYYIDTGDDLNELKLYDVPPEYDTNGNMTYAGVPVAGNGQFIPSLSNPGKILSSVPAYNHFFTYRIRTEQHESVLPFSETFDFNFTLNNTIDESANAGLYIKIPRIETSNKVGNNAIFNHGFDTLTFNDGYGIDIIIGKYKTNIDNPSEIIGITDIVFIPITELTIPFNAINQTLDTGLVLTATRYDYETALNNPNRHYDILNVTPVYNLQTNTLEDTLEVANGKWTLGNIKYKNEVKQNRTTLLIKVPADKWNGSSNPTYNSKMNLNKKDKYITEIAIYDEENHDKPIIYSKISPAIKKTSNLDLNIGLKLDF